MKLGASDYVTKPFTLDKLNSSVRTALKNNKKTYSAISDKSPVECEICINGCEYSFGEISAIAQGIEAQIDYLDSHSKMVTQKTADLARWLGLPDKDIRKWVSVRNKKFVARNNRIKSILDRLERNPVAQIALGLTKSAWYLPRPNKEHN
jgi:two-component SAPR family response regulator